jgi:hypothetical protein
LTQEQPHKIKKNMQKKKGMKRVKRQQSMETREDSEGMQTTKCKPPKIPNANDERIEKVIVKCVQILM